MKYLLVKLLLLASLCLAGQKDQLGFHYGATAAISTVPYSDGAGGISLGGYVGGVLEYRTYSDHILQFTVGYGSINNLRVSDSRKVVVVLPEETIESIRLTDITACSAIDLGVFYEPRQLRWKGFSLGAGAKLSFIGRTSGIFFEQTIELKVEQLISPIFPTPDREFIDSGRTFPTGAEGTILGVGPETVLIGSVRIAKRFKNGPGVFLEGSIDATPRFRQVENIVPVNLHVVHFGFQYLIK